MNCNVCNQQLGAPVYESGANRSITSLCGVVDRPTKIYYCEQCGHCYTPAVVGDLGEYYSQDYKILIESEEEDQYVVFPDGRKTFRFDLQVETLLAKYRFTRQTKLLDFGCAKSTTIKKLCQRNSELAAHLFDVSDMYIPFWRKFLSPDHWATFEPKPEWRAYFDIVTSFFSLEHVADPNEALTTVHGLLADGGKFYCVVPDMYCNIADFVVADHVNHFSEASLRYLLTHNGFSQIELDRTSHYGAFIVTATKASGSNSGAKVSSNSALLQETAVNMRKIADYWSAIADKILQFESAYPRDEAVAIYGSGFYGAFIATCLHRFDQVQCFLDQNPFKQSQQLFDRPIYAPEKLPRQIRYIHVGLNPSIAEKSIADIAAWEHRDHIYNYL